MSLYGTMLPSLVLHDRITNEAYTKKGGSDPPRVFFRSADNNMTGLFVGKVMVFTEVGEPDKQ